MNNTWKFLWQGSYHAQIARVDIDYIPLPGKSYNLYNSIYI